MKVLFLSFEYPPNIIGGAGTYATDLVYGLAKRGIDVHTVTRGETASNEEKTHRVSASKRLYWRRYYFSRNSRGLVHELNRLHKFDLVHINGAYSITRRFKLPTVSTFHSFPNVKQMTMGLKLLRGYKSVNDITHLVLKNPVGSLFDVFLAKASDKIICPSPILAREIASYCFADEQKIHVVPNGVDLKHFDGIESVDGSFLDKYGLQTNSFLLYMGRLSFLKGIQYLVEAFRIVKRQNSAIKLVIAGSGDFEPHLRELACKEKDIVFLGYLSSMEIKKLLYEACLAVVLPSLLYEVAPMAILEGMACGRPILATDVGGNSFMVRHGENGFLSRPADPKNLAEYIRILCEDGTLSRKMGMCGRKLVEKQFSLDRMLTATLRVYDACLATYNK